MPNGLWPSLCQVGLAANRPTQPSEVPVNTFFFYFATDSLGLSIWNPSTNSWVADNGPTLPMAIVSAGATQLGATPVTSRTVVVTTATASSKGVLLPAAATGIEVTIINKGPTFGTKVYPNSHAFINAGASNVADATVLAALKTTIYLALDATHWITIRGS